MIQALSADQRYITRYAESMKMNRAVLMVLRDADVKEALSLGKMLQRVRNLLLDLVRVITIDKHGIQRPREKIGKLVQFCNVRYCRTSTAEAGNPRALRIDGKATLGIEVAEITRPLRIYWHLPEGVLISKISRSSAAYRAGLRLGDVLMSVGSDSVTSLSDYVDALSRYAAGETVRITIYRDGAYYYADIPLSDAK